MIKTGLSLIFLVMFGVPFLFLLIAVIGAYPIALVVIAPIIVLAIFGTAGQ